MTSEPPAAHAYVFLHRLAHSLTHSLFFYSSFTHTIPCIQTHFLRVPYLCIFSLYSFFISVYIHYYYHLFPSVSFHLLSLYTRSIALKYCLYPLLLSPFPADFLSFPVSILFTLYPFITHFRSITIVTSFPSLSFHHLCLYTLTLNSIINSILIMSVTSFLPFSPLSCAIFNLSLITHTSPDYYHSLVHPIQLSLHIPYSRFQHGSNLSPNSLTHTTTHSAIPSPIISLHIHSLAHPNYRLTHHTLTRYIVSRNQPASHPFSHATHPPKLPHTNSLTRLLIPLPSHTHPFALPHTRTVTFTTNYFPLSTA